MSDHKTEKRFREIHEYFCVEPGCEFEGRNAQQGVCHTTEPDLIDYERISQRAQELADEIKMIRKEHYPDPEEYIPWLEAMYECAMLNWAGSLDESIGLRRENALLRLKIEKMEKRDATENS